MPMSSVDDVFRYAEMLLDALVRMPPFDNTQGMGQVGSFPGLVPSTYRAARQARDNSAAVLAIARETNSLLNAVNVETLGRIETGVASAAQAQMLDQLSTDVLASHANTDQILGRIESNLKQTSDFLPTLREDLNDVSAKLDTIGGQLRQDVADLNAKLDALSAQVKALPH
jgi:septal ring factor EnvC (AmiA/AmiB activator)